VEATASKLRAELATARARAQTTQEQLQNQTKLASSKDRVLRSITEESQVAQTKLKGAEDKIVHLRIELRLERVRRLRDRDKQLDHQARMRDCHEAEIRRIAQEARSAQEKLAMLHDLQSRIRTGQYSSAHGVHIPRAPSPMPEAVFTGEYPTSRGILHTDTPPAGPAFESNSSCSTKAAQDPSLHDWGDPSTLQADHLLQISTCFEQVSQVVKGHVAALEGLLERICQLESERAQHVTPTEPDDHCLERELTKLRITEEEVLTLRRNLAQSRKAMCCAESDARDLRDELDKCQATLRESEDERRAMEIQFAERLRLLSAELESSRAQVKASPQATSTSVTLQERINELGAQVTTPRSTRRDPAATVINANCLLRSAPSSTHLPSQDLVDPSSCQTALLQISSPVDRGSLVANDQRSALRELIHRMCHLESESAQDKTPTKPDGSRLEQELAATTEQESRAEVDALQLKCSQATSLLAVRLDRINELEAQVTTLKTTRNYPSPTTTINADPPLPTPETFRNSPSRYQIDPSTPIGAFCLQVAASYDPDSDVVKDQQAKLQEMIEYMRRPEPGSAQDVRLNGHDDRPLEEQLATTAEQLRLAEEEVLTLRRDLDQSRNSVWDVETRSSDVVNSYRTKLSKTEDARRALENKFVEAVENLRLRSAELETSMVEVEASTFKCSQFIFLSAALQERVDELEGEVKLLKGTRDYPALTVASSPSLFVMDTGMVSPPSTQAYTLISDFGDILRNADSKINSISITVPSSLPHLPHVSLPNSSSSSISHSLGISLSQVALDSAHQDRIYGPGSEVMTLEGNRDYSTTTPARIRSHSSLRRVLTDTGMGSPGLAYSHRNFSVTDFYLCRFPESGRLDAVLSRSSYATISQRRRSPVGFSPDGLVTRTRSQLHSRDLSRGHAYPR